MPRPEDGRAPRPPGTPAHGVALLRCAARLSCSGNPLTQPPGTDVSASDDPALIAKVEAMPPQAVNALPFGAAWLDAADRVEAHFTWTGGQEFLDAERPLEVRIRGIPGDGCWLFIRRHAS